MQPIAVAAKQQYASLLKVPQTFNRAVPHPVVEGLLGSDGNPAAQPPSSAVCGRQPKRRCRSHRTTTQGDYPAQLARVSTVNPQLDRFEPRPRGHPPVCRECAKTRNNEP
jgi:hypothetical protein